MTKRTCASCKHIGKMYSTDGCDIFDHICRMSDQRRKEDMSPNADFMAHFCASFDARANQNACNHYVDREFATDDVLKLLCAMAENKGCGEFKFFSEENRLAEQLNDKFIQRDQYAAVSEPGNRAFKLLPLGWAEVKRAAVFAA